MQEIKPGVYKHSKTQALVRVHFVAKHSESLEEFVVYEHLDDHPMSKYWVRPASMWNEEVQINGVRTSRFVFVEE